MKKTESMTWREFDKAIHGYYTKASEEQIMNYDEIVDHDRICHDPDLSIIVLTYNHENSLDECIKSLISQKTRYSYEIILSEDYSSDKTLEICKKYQKKYPNVIRVLAARANYHGLGNGIRARRAVRGRYICWCEGDDHWLSNDKIEKQILYLETHQEYSMVASRYRVVNARHEFLYESPDATLVSCKHTLYNDGYVFCHVSTWCIRRSFYEKMTEIASPIGTFSDVIMLTFVEGLSTIYIMPDVFSEYHVNGAGIWTSLSDDVKVMKTIRGTINRIRFSPEPMRTYGRWNLFTDYYFLAKDSLKKKRFIWFINCILRSIEILFLHPSILRYYIILKRKAVKCG